MIQKVLKLLLLICVVGTFNVQAQTTAVSGKITDASDGSILPGVNVLIKGTTTGVSSDFDGNFSLEVSDPNAILQFSFVGYTSKEVALEGRTSVNVTLEASAESLDEVVVTALGIRKSTKALGYSLTELDGDAISEIPQTNAVNALQGKVAGVNVTQNATGAAGSSRVIIRGNSSLTGNNQPLYVVDGIPISNENNGAAGMWGGNDGGDGVSSLNPQDIASVSVLKGGAASALYGSRASNGVIIVTTKEGKGQEGFGVEFNSSVTFDKVDTTIQDFQSKYGQGLRGAAPTSTEEALEMGLSSWGSQLDGSSVVQWDGVSRPYSSVGSNVDNFYETGTTFINTIALTSSNETLNYRFSVSDLSNEDIMPNAGLNRKTFSLNAGATLAKKLTSTVNAKYIIENVKNRPRLSDAPGNGNFTVANLSPNVDVRFMNPGETEEGKERVYSNNIYSQNPYWAAYNFRNEDVKNRLIASTTLRYDFNDWLYALGRVGIDHYTIRRTSVEPWGTAYIPRGAMTDSEIRYSQVDMDFILGMDKDITEDINLVAFVGANQNSIEQETLYLGGSNFIVPGLEDIGNLENQSRSHDFGERKIGSLYGSVEASYKNFAFLTVTGRNDWFSTLSFPGKTTPNDDFYPSVSGSVILSEIFDLGSTLNYLKLRGGWSQVAGGAQDPYALSLTYQIFGQGHQGQSLGAINGSSVPNANLIPFSKDEFEIGFDARMLDNRLSFDIAYYSNKTTNDIVPVTTSVYSGYGSAIANLGEITNKGIEFLVSGTPVRTDNFNWNISFNGAYNDGEVTGTNADDAPLSLGEPRTQNIEVKHIVGEAYGTLFGTSFVRDANNNIVYDIASNGVPLARIGDRKILGEGVPPLTLGLSNTFTYKDFRLYFLIDGKFGGQVYSGTNAITYGNGMHKETLAGRENGLQVSGVDGDGTAFTTTVAPADLQTYYGRISGIAEPFVEDADYIKFRQLSFGYSFPESIIGDTFISSMDISFIATNLFYLMRSVDNIDPEAAYNVGNAQGLEYFGVPATRSFGFNFNVKF